MEMTTFLFQNGSVIFDIKNPFWCRINLLINNKNIFLGGDSFSIIKEKLLKALKNTSNENVKIQLENQDVLWAISLLETHTSIFISVNFPKTLYFLYKETGLNGYDKLVLSNEEYEKFVNFLCSATS